MSVVPISSEWPELAHALELQHPSKMRRGYGIRGANLRCRKCSYVSSETKPFGVGVVVSVARLNAPASHDA